MSTVYGSTIQSTWRARLDYTVSETPTTYTITFGTRGLNLVNSSYDIDDDQYSVLLKANGTTVESYSTYYSAYTGDSYDDNPEQITIQKTSVAQSIPVSFAIKISSVNSKWWRIANETTRASFSSATSTASATITVPALAIPSITASASRSSANGTTVNVSMSANSYANDTHKYYIKVGSGSATLIGTKTQTSTSSTTCTYTLSNQSLSAISIQAYVVGNTGQSATSTVNVAALPKPTLTVTATRNDTTDTTINIGATVSSWNGDTISNVCVVLDGTTRNYDGGDISNGVYQFSTAITNQSQGRLEGSIVATGRQGESATYSFTIPSAFFTMDIGGSGKSVAFGGQASESNVPSNGRVDMYMDLYYKSKALIDVIYPVGSIYMSVNNVSPQSFIGGTWARLESRFLIGASSSYAVNSTGGASTVTLTTDQIPSHTHPHYVRAIFQYKSGDTGAVRGGYESGASTAATGATGGGQAHNNMPPYLAVYMWKRTE